MSCSTAADRSSDLFDRPATAAHADRRLSSSTSSDLPSSSSSSSSSFSLEHRRRRRSRSMRDRSPSAPAAMAIFPVCAAAAAAPANADGSDSDEVDSGRCCRRRKSSGVRPGVLGLGLGPLAGLSSSSSSSNVAAAAGVAVTAPPASAPPMTAEHGVFRREQRRRRSTVDLEASRSEDGRSPTLPQTVQQTAEDVVMADETSPAAVAAAAAIDAAVASGVTLEPGLPPVVFPLGQPTLRVAFSQEEGEEDVPPCFYPGQTIPTTLFFELPRYTTLAHALRPELTMSLVGVLRVLRPTDGRQQLADESGAIVERSLINVGVSLEEGLKLWAKDAGAAWTQLSERRQRGRADPAVGLPGGKYTLPLTVQVPTHPRLPPSFRLPGSIFEIVYELEVSLTIDRPDYSQDPTAGLDRVELVRTSREFTLLPTTLPSQPPVLPPLDGLLDVPQPAASIVGLPISSFSSAVAQSQALVGLGISAPTGWMDKLQQAFVPLRQTLSSHSIASQSSGSSSRSHSPAPMAIAGAGEGGVQSWSVVPSLSTSAFSPSSNVPLDLTLVAPVLLARASANDDDAGPSAALPEGQLLVRASIIRREHAFSSASAPSKLEESRGLVMEEEIVSASGAFDLGSLSTNEASSTTVRLPRINLPLGFGQLVEPWTSGMTTSLTVSPDPFQAAEHEDDDGQAHLHTHCSSRFYIALQVAYLPSPSPPPTNSSNSSSSRQQPATNDFELGRSLFIPSVLRSRSLLIPITIGSVGEPSGARHRRTWRELYLATDERTGEEAPRIVSGSVVDDERGWLLPPPSYETALGEKEYVL